MKTCLALFCLLAITPANSTENFQIAHPRFLNPNTIIRQVFEMLRLLIKNGSQDIVPILDPMEFEHYTLDISVPNKLLTLNANFTNGVLKGLGDFEVVDAEFIKSEIAVYISIICPLLTVTAEAYEMKGNVYQAIPLAGRGNFEFQIYNLKLRSKIYLKQSEDGQSAIVDRLQGTEFSVEKILSRTEFDVNIDEIFNALIGDLLADRLTLYSKLIIMEYSASLVQYANAFLEQFETWTFIAAML